MSFDHALLEWTVTQLGVIEMAENIKRFAEKQARLERDNAILAERTFNRARIDSYATSLGTLKLLIGSAIKEPPSSLRAEFKGKCDRF